MEGIIIVTKGNERNIAVHNSGNISNSPRMYAYPNFPETPIPSALKILPNFLYLLRWREVEAVVIEYLSAYPLFIAEYHFLLLRCITLNRTRIYSTGRE